MKHVQFMTVGLLMLSTLLFNAHAQSDMRRLTNPIAITLHMVDYRPDLYVMNEIPEKITGYQVVPFVFESILKQGESTILVNIVVGNMRYAASELMISDEDLNKVLELNEQAVKKNARPIEYFSEDDFKTNQYKTDQN